MFFSQKPSLDKVNGPLSAYDINYKEKGLLATVKVIRVKTPSTSGNLINLKIWTDYVIKIRVTNGDYTGPWSPELPAKTAQDGLSLISYVLFNGPFICLFTQLPKKRYPLTLVDILK